MSVLKAYFDGSVNQCSPSRGDVQRVVNFDEDGNEFISYEPIDYPTLVASRGCVSDWSLNSLLSAGIDPKFNIHTGLNTRLEGASIVNDMAAQADALFAEGEKES